MNAGAAYRLQASSASFVCQLGLTGNRTNLVETFFNPVSEVTSTNTYTWQYDNLYRLTNETISGFGSVTYGYDGVGNRTNRSGSNPQTFTYNTNDWLGGDSYDANGNTTNSGSKSYQYDVLNHLTNVQQ